jgi:hypothetical protein
MRPEITGPTLGDQVPPALRGHGARRALLATVTATVLGFAPAIVFAAPAYALPGDITATSDLEVAEGDPLTFDLIREGGSASPLVLNYTVTGTATSGEDFEPFGGTTTFNPSGSNVTKRFTLRGIADTLDEDDETVIVTFTDAGDNDSHVYTFNHLLVDDDAVPTYSLSAPDPVLESAGNATVTATLSAASGFDIDIPLTTSDGTATDGQDYTGFTDRVITIEAGDTFATTNIPITDDLLDEVANQTILVSEGDPSDRTHVQAMAGSYAVKIADNDLPPVVSVLNPANAVEGSPLTFQATLSAASEQQVTVVANTGGGTATAGSDYTAVTNQTLTFAPGDTSEDVVVTTAGDLRNEVTPETVDLTLSAPTLASLSLTNAVATGGIDDDDTAPTITLTPGTVTEGDSGTSNKTFTVTLSAASGQVVTVGYATSAGTATAGTDFDNVTPGTLTFNPGDTVKTFTVPVHGDTMDEPNEAFNVILSNQTNNLGVSASLGTTSIALTDDDAKPQLSTFADVTRAEGSGAANFTLTLTNPSDQPIVLDVAATDDSAEVDGGTAPGTNDYDAPNSTVTFLPGEVSKTIAVNVNGDSVFEADETATIDVTIPGSENDIAGGGLDALLTLTNDDLAPAVTLSSETGAEGTSLAVKATVVGVAQDDIPVVLTLAGDGTNPAQPADFVNGGPFNIVIPGGDNTVAPYTIHTFDAQDDVIDEASQQVRVSLTDSNDVIADTSALQTITDDINDLPPAVSVDDVSVNENAGTAAVDVDLTFLNTNGASSTEQAVVVNYTTVDDDAIAGDDYTAAPNGAHIDIPAGTLAGTITVPILNDAAYELDEDFLVNVTSVSPTGAAITDGSAAVTIGTNDLGARPGFSVTPTVTKVEGSDGDAEFTVSLNAPAPQDVDFTVVAHDDSAVDGGTDPGNDDFDAPAGTFTIEAGQSEATVSIPVNDDAVYETTETMTIDVDLANGEIDATGNLVTSTLTITDTDAAPTVALSAASTDEGDDVVVMGTVTGVAEDAIPVTVTLAGQANGPGGNAADADDFDNVGPISVNIPAGDNTAAPIELGRFLAEDDAIDETTQTVLVTLHDAASHIADATTYAAIVDDAADLPPNVSIGNETVNENAGTVHVTVDLDFDANTNGATSTEQDVVLNYSTANGTATAGSDYTAAANGASITIPAGDVDGTITVPILEDSAYEVDETFTVTIDSVDPSEAVVTDNAATVTISTNDLGARPSFSVANVTKAEGSTGPAVFTVTLTSAAPEDITLTVGAVNGTAVDATTTAGSNDFDAPPTTVTILKGASSAEISVPVNNDTVFEATETMTLNVSLAFGEDDATGGADASTLTITDTDAAPTVTLIEEAGAEGTNIAVNATVNGATQDAIPLQVAIAGASRSGSDAAEVSDFVNSGPVTVNIPAGVHNNVVLPLREFRANNDTIDENQETVVATVTDAGEHVTTASGALKINDDVNDTAPSVSIGDVDVDEDDGPATVDVDLTFGGDTTATERTVVVNYQTVNGTATAPGQYTARTNSISFAPGVVTGEISIPVSADLIDEPNQTFRVEITSVTPADVTLADDSGTVTILDDDADVPPPTFSVANRSVSEDDGEATFEVVLSHASSQDITFTTGVTDGSAVDVGSGLGSNDYNQPPTTLTIPAGQTTGDIVVPVNNDTVYEGTETASLSVSLAPGETDATGSADTSTLSILDDDTVPSIALNSTSNFEGEDLAVTATITGRAQDDIVFDLWLDGNSDGDNNPAEDSDYEDNELQATIPAGTASGSTIILRSIHLEDDTIDEPIESLEVLVEDVEDRVQSKSSVYRITDDPNDLAPAVSITDESIVENLGSVDVGVELNFVGNTTATERDMHVSYYTVNGSARTPSDYTAEDGILTIPAGDEYGEINIPIVNDNRDENDEKFFVKLDAVSPNDNGIDDDSAEVEIIDNDATVAPTLNAPSGRIGAGPVTVTGTAREGTQVQLWTAPGTVGDDFDLVAYTTASSDGTYSFTRHLPTGYRLYTRANGLSSPIKTLRVKHDPVLNGGSTAKGVVKLTVVGDPKLSGLAVQIQRLNTNGTWSTVASGKTASNGTFAKTFTGLKSGTAITYRAYIAGDVNAGLLSGVSASKRIGIR